MNPGNGRVFRWLLSSTQDTFGNRMDYGYLPDPDGGPQRYLQTVQYADYGDPADPSYAVTVTIDYGAPGSADPTPIARPDPFSDRRPGFELRTALRASQISVTTLASDRGAATGPTTTVDLIYVDQTSGPVSSGVSLLSRIGVAGHDPAVAGPQPLPPLTFTYSDWEPTARRYRPLPTGGPAGLPPVPLTGPLDLVDLFADGLPSVLQLDGTARYWRNRGDAVVEPPRPVTATPAGATLGSPGLLLSDLDGDGRPELAITTNAGTTVWSLAAPSGAGFAPRPRFTPAVPTVGYTDPQVRVLDLDGDHLADLLVGGTPALTATGDGQGGFAGLRPLADAPPPLANLADPHVHLADLTGDGLTDVALVYDGAVTYWPSLGHGRSGRRCG